MSKNLTFDIRVELPEPMQTMGIINRQVFPLLRQAVRAVAHATAENWREEVYNAKLWSGEKDAYADSIDVLDVPGQDFSMIVRATYRHAQAIETGRGAYDLKKMLDTSTKVRRTEKGKRFLVIPMRHNVTKLKQAGLYDMAKALEESMITGMGIRPSGEVTHLSPNSGMTPSSKQSGFLSSTADKGAMMTPKATYNWGGRLSNGQMKAAGVSADARKFAKGMYRFKQSSGQGKSSGYLTFRIMMEGSTGWIKPAEPGQRLAQKVTQQMQPKATRAFQAAIAKSLGKG